MNNTVTLRKTIEKQLEIGIKENSSKSSNQATPAKSINLTKTINTNQIDTNSTYVKEDKKEKIKNKEKICDVIYLRTIDNLLSAVNTELDFGKFNHNFKDDINYINVFQENLTKLISHLQSKINYNAGLKIVRWYKNKLEIKKARNILNQLKLEDQRKKAAIVLQKNWRRHQVQKNFSKLINAKYGERNKAILVVQRNCRVYLAKKQLKKLRELKEQQKVIEQQLRNQSALIIQRNWRNLLFRIKFNKAIENAKAERKRQEVLNSAAAIIQKRWRVYLLKKSLSELVDKRKRLYNQSALVIQKAWKSYHFRNTIRSLIEERRSRIENDACLMIQKAWRNYLFRKQLKSMFEIRRSKMQSALIIQRNWRQFLFKLKLDKAIKDRRSRIENKSALVIQRAWKSYRLRNVLRILMKERRSKLENELRSKSAAIIQSAWRMYKANKLEQLKHQDASALIIQRIWRSYSFRKNLERRINLNYFRSIDDAALMIQKVWRGYQGRKQMKEELKKREAAVKIQKLWRGHFTRVKCLVNNKDRRLSGIFERITQANMNAESQPKVGEKTKVAIQKLLTYRYQSKIISVLKELESTTNLSNESCIQMANKTVIEVLLQVVNECNRSEPSLEIIKIVFSIILNIAKNDKALPLLYNSSLKEATIETLNKHYKRTGIFLKAMTLLYILLKYNNVSNWPIGLF